MLMLMSKGELVAALPADTIPQADSEFVCHDGRSPPSAGLTGDTCSMTTLLS
jgi:hypothetical protein